MNKGTVALTEQLGPLKILLKLAHDCVLACRRTIIGYFQPVEIAAEEVMKNSLDSHACGLNTFVFCGRGRLEPCPWSGLAGEMDQSRLIVSITLPIALALGFNATPIGK